MILIWKKIRRVNLKSSRNDTILTNGGRSPQAGIIALHLAITSRANMIIFHSYFAFAFETLLASLHKQLLRAD